MEVNGKLKKMVFGIGVMLAVVVLVVAGFVTRGACLISAIPTLVDIKTSPLSRAMVSYDTDPNRTVNDEDVAKLKHVLLRQSFLIGFYHPDFIVLASSTDASARFSRRETVLTIRIIQTNKVWQVTGTYKVTFHITKSRDYFSRILDNASAALP